MSVVADAGQMFCTTSEVHFGPQCRDDDEAEALICHLRRTRGRDPRVLSEWAYMCGLVDLRMGLADGVPTHPNRLCNCGSGKPYTSIAWHGLHGGTGTRCADHPDRDTMGPDRGFDGETTCES